MNAFVLAAILTFGLQVLGWAAATALQTETFYDVLGGINFLLLASVGLPATSSRLLYMTILFFISRGWLLVFLAWRAHSRKGDSRFDDVKTKPLFFLVYWMVQGCWVFLISLPLLVLQTEAESDVSPSLLDYFLLAGFACSIFLEIASDIQKAVWVERGRKGSFCQIGFWKYSRHPNYAGEILQWCFAAGLCARSKLWWVGLFSPLFTMTILLTMSGTGIMHAEGKNLKRYYESEDAEEYRKYRTTTSPLFPMIGYGKIPLGIKRVLFFEWKAYEYKPESEKTA